MTEARLKNRIGQGWFAAVLLAIFILLLTGSTWHSTTKLESRPVDTHTSIAQDLVVSEPPVGQLATTASEESQAPVASATAFAPFLDVVPSQDGTELFIKAGGVGELGGTVYANVGIGPSHDKGSWTMTYSDTVQAYVTTAPGFTPSQSQDGNVSITTTLGLDTGAVDFNRVYVPASTIQTIRSLDGNLELDLADTDIITFNTYVAVVPSYAPPGPAPLGHRFVGSTYSVRAAGALVETDKPMSLRLFYNDTTLAGADPHTLSIFRWDAASKHWDDRGGTLFFTQRRLSAPTRIFTSYALMAITTWRDEFDDLSGMDFAQFNNVVWEATSENRKLILVSTPGSGSAVSQPITPTTNFANWGSLAFSSTVDPPTTTLTVDILDLDGSEVLPDVASGTSLAGLIDPVQYPSLRLRVNMSSTAAGETPALERWELSWQVEEHKTYLPMVLK